MATLLKRSRIPISIVPERLVAEAALEEGWKLDELPADEREAEIVFLRDGIAGMVLSRAVDRWWAAQPRWTRLAFWMQHQEQTRWCWAAVAVSVAKYYVTWSRWTQCTMVNRERGQTTCCVDGSTPVCNRPNVLDSPLRHAGVLDRIEFAEVDIDAIGGEIDAGRPVCWRIGWNGGGGHFAVIEGYRSLPDPWVAVDDPWYGESDLPLATLTGGGYQGCGDWTHTYFTRRPPIFLADTWIEEEVRLPSEVWTRIRDEATDLSDGDDR